MESLDKIETDYCMITKKREEVDYINRTDLQYNSEHIESQWTEVQMPYQKKYMIGNIYRPPDGDIEKTLEQLNIVIEKIKYEGNNEIFCLGDLNINLLKPSKGRKEFYNLTSTNGLQQLIKDPTRQTHKTKTILDLIITDTDFILDSDVLYNSIGDHFQVFVTRKHTKKEKYRPPLKEEIMQLMIYQLCITP